MSGKGRKGVKGPQNSQDARKTRSQGPASPGNRGGGRGGFNPSPSTSTTSPRSAAVLTAPGADLNTTPPTKGQPSETLGSAVGEIWPKLSAGNMVQTPSPPLSGGIWRGRQNTGPLSDSRLQLLQEQLEESQRELAKAKAEAAKSAASQQQEPTATAQ